MASPPPEESSEDAATRRAMLDYALNEVGAVVAEINLEEPDFEYDSTSDQDDATSLFTSPDDEDGEGGMSYTTSLSELDSEDDSEDVED